MPDPESAARSSLARSLIIYGAFFAADVALIWYIVTAGVQGAGYVTLSIFTVVGMLLGYQVVQHLRDLRSPLAESEGIVQRKWTRADLVIALQSFYITVDRTVFRVRPEDYVHIDEAMYVKVVHFPYTLNVVSIHEMLAPPPPSVPPPPP